jgi:hypothetical protein
VRGSEQTTGIELTQLFRETPPVGQPLQARERLRDRVVHQARAHYEASGGPVLDVAVSFSTHPRLTKQTVPTVAAALKRLVTAMNVGEGQVVSWEYDWVNRDLFPDEIVAVRVARLAALTKSHCSCPDAGLVPDVERSECGARQLRH